MKNLVTSFPYSERSSILPSAFWKRILMTAALPAMVVASLTDARAQYGHTGTQTYNSPTPAIFDGSVPGGLDYSVGFGGGFSSTPGEAVISGSGNVHVVNGANLILGDATNNGGPAVEGTLNQTGGTVAVDNASSLYLGSYGKGVYNLNGGILLIGGTTSIKTGYDNSGGSPKFGPPAVGAPPANNYEFNLGGGTIQVTGSALNTGVTLSLTDNTVSQIDTNSLGATLTGTLTGAGGLNKTGSGTLTLDGGTTRNVGLLTSNQGSTDQLNGTTRTGEFMVGSGAGANAVFNLSGGDIFVDQLTEFDMPPASPSFRVGDFGGTGVFNQTSGNVTVGSASQAGSLNIGNQGGTGTYNISAGSLTYYAGYFNLGRSTQATASSGTLNISGSALVDIKAGGDLIIGDRDAAGANGSGLIVQTGGILRIETGARLGLSAAGNGEYQLNGGTLEIGGSNSLVGHYEGGAGTYALKLGGGTIATTSTFSTAVDASLEVGTTSFIDTSGGDATWSGNFTGSGALNKIGSGTLTLSGAANNFGVFNAQLGTTIQTAGITSSAEFLVASSTAGQLGAFTLDGGSLNISGLPSFGGTTATLRVGDWGGVGIMTQKTGTAVNITGAPGNPAALHIGNQGGQGIYNLEGGDINLDGGVLALGRTQSASAAPSFGYLIMTGGNVNLTNGSTMVIGDMDGANAQGTGILAQSGGVVSVDSGSTLYLSAHGAGTYNLMTGGTLSIGGNSLQANLPASAAVGSFNLEGGLIATNSALSTSVDANLISGTTSFIDTTSGNASWSGNFTGPGAFNKIGSGTLHLSGSANSFGVLNTYSGDTVQTAGSTASGEFLVGSAPFAQPSTGTFTLEGGSLNISGLPAFGGTTASLRVGDFGGTGIMTQKTGTDVNITGAPGNAAVLHIGNQGGNGTYNLEGGDINLDGGLLALGRTATASAPTGSVGQLNMSGGNVNLANNSTMVIGDMDGANQQGTGTVTQTGGVISVDSSSNLYLSAYGAGTYNLNTGGRLEIGGTSLQANLPGSSAPANFNLGGGTIATNSALTTSVDANLVSGTTSFIDTTSGNASWSGNFTGPGALNKIGSGTLHLSGSANSFGVFNTYSGDTVQTAGSTASGEFLVGSAPFAQPSTGTFTLEGGSLNISGLPAFGGTTASLRVGDFGGTGIMTQKTGTDVNITGAPGNAAVLHIGNQGGNGTYNLEGGDINLEGGLLALGRTATASAPTGSVGQLNMSGGNVNLANNSTMVIGDMDGANQQGTGTVTQTGGVISVDSSSNLYLSAYGAGTYNLNTGGRLEIGGTSLQANLPGSSAPANFNLGGGTIAPTSDLITSVNATLVTGTTSQFDQGNTITEWSGVMSGTGNIQSDAGANGGLAFMVPQTYTGTTTIATGNLGSVGLSSSNVIVNTGANYYARGTNIGAVTLDGGTLNVWPGLNGSTLINTLTVGSYSATAGSNTNFNVATPGTSDTINVTGGGSIVLGGALSVNDTGGYNYGTYTLFSHTGSSVTGAYDLSGTATPNPGDSLFVQSNATTVKLYVTTDASTQYWLGTTGDVSAPGGTPGAVNVTNPGTWNAGNANWSTADGLYTTPWQGKKAIFLGTGSGTKAVTLSGNASFEKLEFQAAGYHLSGGSLTISDAPGDPNTRREIQVDTGTVTIASPISGTAGLEKAGTGILSLTGASTFTGDTRVSAGRLSLSGDLSGMGGNIENNATLYFASTQPATSFNGDITGTGSVTKNGAGETALTGDLSYNAVTSVTGSGSVLRLKDNFDSPGGLSATGVSGNRFNVNTGATLILEQNETTGTFGRNVTGAGTLRTTGVGELTLGGTINHTGGTIIGDAVTPGGTVHASSSAQLGAANGDVTLNKATLDITGNGKNITQNLLGSVTGGAIKANGNLFLGALDGTSTINTGATIIAGSHDVYLISDNSYGIGSHTASVKVGGLSLAGGGTVTGVNGINVLPGGSINATGSADINGSIIAGDPGTPGDPENGDFSGYVEINGPTGAGQSLHLNYPAFGNYIVTGNTRLAPDSSAGFSPGLAIIGSPSTPGNVTQASPLIEIWGTTRGTAPDGYDAANIFNGSLTYNGTITITFDGGSYTPAEGDIFNLVRLSNNGNTNTFSLASGTIFDFSGATLPGGLTWDTSDFYTNANGDLNYSITIVPETSATGLLLLTVLGAAGRRRRAVHAAA